LKKAASHQTPKQISILVVVITLLLLSLRCCCRYVVVVIALIVMTTSSKMPIASHEKRYNRKLLNLCQKKIPGLREISASSNFQNDLIPKSVIVTAERSHLVGRMLCEVTGTR